MFTYGNQLFKEVKGLRSKRDGITKQDKAKVIYLKEFESMDYFKTELANYIGYYNHKKN